MSEEVKEQQQQGQPEVKQEQHEGAEKAHGWLVGILTGMGVPGSIARIIAGAIIGAVAAWYVATASGCTVNYTQGADGSLKFQGSVKENVIKKQK